MSNITSKYTENYVHKIFVDSLEKDGALCDYYSKYYKEYETSKGGKGNRLAFTNYNNRVIRYHNILRVLTGERRANVYETIPTIDFANPTYSGFLYTYPLASDNKTPISNEIINVNASVKENPLELIDSEDKFTINRALSGLPTAEHFYNTSDLLSSEYNLQVSIYSGNCEYIYRGVITPKTMVDGVIYNRLRKSNALFFKSSTNLEVYFNEGYPDITPYRVSDSNGRDVYKDMSEDIETGNEIQTGYTILNTDCGWTPAGINDNAGNIATPIQHEGQTIVTKVSDEYMQLSGRYSLKVSANDILVALPKNYYSNSSNKIILLKYNNNAKPYTERDSNPIIMYRRNIDGKFYVSNSSSKVISPIVGRHYLDGNQELKDVYYTYDIILSQYLKTTVVPSDMSKVVEGYLEGNTFFSDKELTQEIVPNNDIYYKDLTECTRKVYRYNPETYLFEIDRNSSVASDGRTIETKVKSDEYTCYILYVESFNDSFSISSSFREITPDSSVTQIFDNKFMLDILKKYLVIDINYVSKASGLLAGLFCEPLIRENTSTGTEVTLWKFINEVQKAKNKGVDIDVGTRYFESHLLNRGKINDAPLQLTASDNKNKGYKGKFTLIYDTLENFNITDSLINPCRINNWSGNYNYSSWFMSNTNRQGCKEVTSVITKYDYTDINQLSYNTRQDLAGKSTKTTNLRYPHKFYKLDNSIVNFNDFEAYIAYFKKAFEKEGVISIDLSEKDRVVSSYTVSQNGNGACGSEGSPNRVGSYGDYNQNVDLLERDSRVCFFLSYNIHKRRSGSISNHFESPEFRMITPRELFFDNNSNNDTILVFPEYNKYFPEKVYLISKYDLGLEVYNPNTSNNKGICSFLSHRANSQDKAIMFRVEDVTKILPSTKYTLEVKGLATTTMGYTEMLPSWKNLSREEYQKTKDATVIRGKQYYWRYYDSGYSAYRYFPVWIPFSNYLEHYYERVVESNRDCYIYTLSYFNIPLSQSIGLYNWDDEPITLNDIGTNGKIVGLSTEGFFSKDEIHEDSQVFYRIKESNRGTDFDLLRNSIIVVGVPYLRNGLKYANFSVNGVPLQAFDRLLSKENVSNTTKTALRTIVSNWHLSDGEDNPILMRDMPDLLQGIIDFENDISDLANSQLVIKSGGQDLLLTPESFSNIKSLISSNTMANLYDVNISHTSITNLFNTIGDENTKGLRVYFNSSTRDYYITDNKGTAKDGYSLYGTVYQFIRSDYITNKEIPSLYKKAINTIVNTSLNIDVKIKGTVERKSLTFIKNTLSKIFKDENTLTREDCQLLDDIFGNDTLAFLNIGDKYTYNNRKLTYTSQMSKAQESLSEEVTSIITDTINTLYSVESEGVRQEQFQYAKSRLEEYFTRDSINRNVFPVFDTLYINTPGLVINVSTPKSRSVFQSIKNEESPSSYRYNFFGIISYFWLARLFWSYYSLDDFIMKFYYNASIFSADRIKIRNSFMSRVSNVIASIRQDYTNNVISSTISRSTVKDYITNGDMSDNNNPLYMEEEIGSGIQSYNTTNNRIRIVVYPPMIYQTLNSSNRVTSLSIGYDSSIPYITKSFSNIFDDHIDITEDVLWGIVEYIRASLEGTNVGDEDNPRFVRYVKGEGDTPIGRPNSIYYKRYQMLNNRMNRLTGDLWTASSTLRNSSILYTINGMQDQTVKSYEPFTEIMPISIKEEMTYLPTQKATMSNNIIEGKFYSTKELEALKSQISSKCVLTCTKCSIQDVCPFYDKDEITKMYCSEIESIDLWVKDNKLDLLYHDRDNNTPSLKSEDNNEGIDINKLVTVHYPYGEVSKRLNVESKINNIEDIRTHLKSNSNLKYDEYIKDDMGWLLNARYGTVQKNNLTSLIENNEEYKDLADKIHPYKYLYDAVFINDEETYVNYRPSTYRYNVSFEMGPADNRKVFTGNTKIMIPSSLKILANNKNEDDVYLVSDDRVDANGEPILPVIYLGKIRDLQYVFDLQDDGIEGGVKDPLDSKLYANDVAQWCMNYYKGDCYDYPIDESLNNMSENPRDRDQYWMSTVYKKIDDKWYSFSGRKREITGYNDMLIDSDDFEDTLAISGRPMIADYINFLRKVSIRIYDRENHTWLIPWINESLPIIDKERYFKGLDNDIEKIKEKQRATLCLMKTNLRLVVIKN